MLVGSMLLALVLKLMIASATVGTNDVATFYRFAAHLSHDGLEATYRSTIAFNHPPITAYYLILIYRISGAATDGGASFPLLLRLPGILSDVVTLLVVCRVSSCLGSIPGWALVSFALSPVSLMISGFHGNTDSVMTMFLVLATYMAARERSISCAAFFALSCQIKIVPLLFLPLVLVFWWERHRIASFIWSFAGVSLLLWWEPLLKFPISFARNVLTYGSWWGIWGITYWLRLTGLPEFSRVSFVGLSWQQTVVTATLKIMIAATILLLSWRRRRGAAEAIFASIAYGWLAFFALSPGICAQYLVWLAPFVLVLSARYYVWLTISSSIFLFFFYNVTAGGLPWSYANSTSQLNTIWTPWSLWPWAAVVFICLLSWRTAVIQPAEVSEL